MSWQSGPHSGWKRGEEEEGMEWKGGRDRACQITEACSDGILLNSHRGLARIWLVKLCHLKEV